MKKTLKAGLGLFLSAAMLAGCSSNGESSETTTAAGGDTTTVAAGEETTVAETTEEPGANFAENVSLKLWGSQEDQDMLATMVENFKALYPNTTWDITFGVVSESDAKTEVLKDTEAAADVFAFASDQLGEMQSAGALYRITRNKDAIIAANSEASITASMVDGELYAYPSSADTYFLLYDKSLLSETDVLSLETILSKDLGAGVTNFSFDIDNGWYDAAFFFAAGCTLFGESGTDATQCDFNSDKGVLAATYMINLVGNSKFANHDDAKLQAGFTARQLGATVTGTWNVEPVQEALGDDMGVTKLPTITFSDGTTVNMSSMANFKLYGVNSQTAYPIEAMALAEYLTGEEAQEIRFNTRSFAPTNLALAGNEEVMSANPVIAAIAAQNEFATLQPAISQMGNFWTPAEAFGAGIEDGSINTSNLQEKLDLLVESILSSIG